MEYIEVTAKTVDDAITEACKKLTVPSDRLDYVVVEEGSSGFFGIGSKPAVIKAREKEYVEEAVKAPVKAVEKETVKQQVKETTKAVVKTAGTSNSYTEAAITFLNEVFAAMHMKVTVEASFHEEDRSLDVDLSGEEMGVLIGKRGQTLDSVQYLVSLVVNKDVEEYIRVKVDTENYRERRKETLENLAKNISFKVKRTKRPVSLEPMNPYERRIIHSALQDDKYVTTHSEGEEPFRRVVVTLKR